MSNSIMAIVLAVFATSSVVLANADHAKKDETVTKTEKVTTNGKKKAKKEVKEVKEEVKAEEAVKQ